MADNTVAPRCPKKGCENYCQTNRFKEGSMFFPTCYGCRTKCPNSDTSDKCLGVRGKMPDGRLFKECVSCAKGDAYDPNFRKGPKGPKAAKSAKSPKPPAKGPKGPKGPKASEDPSDVIDNGPKSDDDN